MKDHHKTIDFTDALRYGIPVHINEVQNGIKCNCICPSCKQPLVAYNNPKNKKAHHFQHQSLSNCKNYYETMIHYWAKEIINEQRELSVPNHDFELSDYARGYTDYEWSKDFPKEKITAAKVEFDKILIEKHQDGIKPDLICFVKNRKIHVEIAVTHFIDELKAIKIENLNVTSLEIDLSTVDRSLQKEKLKNILSNGNIERMTWFNNKAIKQKKALSDQRKSTIRIFILSNMIEKKVYGKAKNVYKCPLFKTEHDVTLHNCERCQYLVYTNEIYEGSQEQYDNKETIYPKVSINCIGHIASKFDALLIANEITVRENKAFNRGVTSR
ncbi:MAG: hypothetical protein K9G40_00245 [Crocinitomicaceae bacterium]|nr:hypothetical protein [Crocinitomicaceae bacterium]MCF8433213.1 hypothetical protein [Crocinitomicaceae bacterium]